MILLYSNLRKTGSSTAYHSFCWLILYCNATRSPFSAGFATPNATDAIIGLCTQHQTLWHFSHCPPHSLPSAKSGCKKRDKHWSSAEHCNHSRSTLNPSGLLKLVSATLSGQTCWFLTPDGATSSHSHPLSFSPLGSVQPGVGNRNTRTNSAETGQCTQLI